MMDGKEVDFKSMSIDEAFACLQVRTTFNNLIIISQWGCGKGAAKLVYDTLHELQVRGTRPEDSISQCKFPYLRRPYNTLIPGLLLPTMVLS